MLEKIIYYNHNGEALYLGSEGLYANENDLRNFSNQYTSKNGKIVAFNKGIVEKSIPIIIKADTQERAVELKNKITEFADRDIFALQPGKIVINGYYMQGYLYENIKSNYLIDAAYSEHKLKFVTDNPYWIKEHPFYFKASKITSTNNKRYAIKSNYLIDAAYSEHKLKFVTDNPYWIKEHPFYFKASKITSTNNKRYANKYAYRYANGLNNTYITNEHYAECNFHMNIYGPCVKPSVYIGRHEYHVDAILEAGERLEIDSAAETVTKVMNSGKRVNMFHYRSFGNTVFQPIQTGKQNIFWDGKFDFDLILFEERSEPKWS